MLAVLLHLTNNLNLFFTPRCNPKTLSLWQINTAQWDGLCSHFQISFQRKQWIYYFRQSDDASEAQTCNYYASHN